MVVRENIDQYDEVRIVYQLLAQRDDAGYIQADNAVSGVLQVLLANLEHFIFGALLFRRCDNIIELSEIIDRIAVQRSSGPFLLVE